MLKYRHSFVSPRLRRKRQRAAILKVLAAIILVVGGFFSIRALSGLAMVTVSKLDVSGNDSIPVGAVISLAKTESEGWYAGLIPKTNFFFFPKGAIADALKKTFPKILKVEVKMSSLSAAVINITEREPYAVWCRTPGGSKSNDGCYFVDNGGFIFSPAVSSPAVPLPRFAGGLDNQDPVGRRYLTEEKFAALRVFIKYLDSKGSRSFSFNHLADGDFEVTLDIGGKILFNDNQDISRLISNLEAALRKENVSIDSSAATTFQYIDLRFGNKVFLKRR
jgi:cell division septal protein FtsQ